MEKSKKFLTAAVALFAACLIALGAMLCIPAVARAEGTATPVADLKLVESAGGSDTIELSKATMGGNKWMRVITESGATTIDTRSYGGLVFDFETNSTTGAKIDTRFRVGNDGSDATTYTCYGNKVFALYVYENGECKTNSDLKTGSNHIPANFKGTISIPWGAFEKNDAATLTKDNLTATDGILPVFVQSSLSDGSSLKMSNIRLVADTTVEATIVSLNNTFAYIDGQTISESNYTDLKTRYEAAKAKYDGDYLNTEQKAKVTNASKMASIEAKFKAQEVAIVKNMVDALTETVTAANYEEVKAAYESAKTAYDGLDEADKDEAHTAKLNAVATALEVCAASIVSDKITALATDVTASNYAETKNNYASVKKEYDELTDAQKETVTNSGKLDEVKAALTAFETAKADEIVLVNNADGSTSATPTVDAKLGAWIRFTLNAGSATDDFSFASGFSFDIRTDLEVKGGFTFFLDEDGDSAKRMGGYGNRTFGYFVYENGVCKTNSALGQGANVLPAGFKGRVFIPWGAFERTITDAEGNKTVVYGSAEKAANMKLIIFVDQKFSAVPVTISNVRLSNGIATSATVDSADKTFAYAAAADITAENYTDINTRFVAAKSKYGELGDTYKAKVTNADKIAAIETKLETYRVGVATAMIGECVTDEITSENYETAKNLLAEAKRAYGALSDGGKERVTNAENIALATAAIETYEAGLFDAKIDALPGSVSSDNVTDAKVELEKIRAEYDGLDDGVKAKVGGADKIAALSEKIDVYEAGEVQSLIAALTDKIDKDNYKKAKKQYLAAQKAYGALTANGKTKVTNASKFEAVKAAIEKYENTDPINVAAIITIAVGAAVVVAGAVLIIVKAKKSRG